MQQQNQLPGHSVPGLNRMAAEDGHDPQPQHAIHNSQGSSIAQSSPMGAIAGPSNLASVLGTGRTLRSYTQRSCVNVNALLTYPWLTPVFSAVNHV